MDPIWFTFAIINLLAAAGFAGYAVKRKIPWWGTLPNLVGAVGFLVMSIFHAGQ